MRPVVIPFRRVVVITVALPLFGFIFIIFWSILTDFEDTTSTHCGVDNYLPSISAAVAGPVQETVWKFCIIVHTIPRLWIATKYLIYLVKIIREDFFVLIGIALFANVVEILGLLCLSVYNSTNHFEMHKVSFILFIAFSQIYFVVHIYILGYCRERSSPPSDLERKSILYKRRIQLVNVTSFLGALYAYHRHNSFCEPGAYTVFAFCEYLVVLSNMAFHFTGYWDFFDDNVGIDCCSPKAYHLIAAEDVKAAAADALDAKHFPFN